MKTWILNHNSEGFGMSETVRIVDSVVVAGSEIFAGVSEAMVDNRKGRKCGVIQQ